MVIERIANSLKTRVRSPCGN